METTATRCRISFAAACEGIDAVDRVLTEFLEQSSVDVDVFAVRMLIREAVLNAVIHGCGGDESRTVRVGLRLGEDGVVLDVEDDGPGFDWRHHQENTDDLSEGGRGVDLLGTYATRVEYNEAGNRVTLYREYRCAPPSERPVREAEEDR